MDTIALRQVLDEPMRVRRPRSETSSNSHNHKIDTGWETSSTLAGFIALCYTFPKDAIESL